MTEKAKILVVDDDEAVRRSYLLSLRSDFRNVEAAGDGEGALRAMERDRFDVVLLDLRMPGTDGITVLKTMKQRWPESEVVVITGYPTIETAKEAVRLGAYDYLAKPVGPADVINATDGAMTHKRWTLHGRHGRNRMTGSNVGCEARQTSRRARQRSRRRKP